jgi:hypothetical protein
MASDRENSTDSVGWLQHHPAKDEPYYRGPTIEQIAQDACRLRDLQALGDALGRWRAFVEELRLTGPVDTTARHPLLSEDDGSPLPPELLDLALSNFVVQPDGLRFIDREWRAAGGVSIRPAMARALWLFACDLTRTGSDHPWASESSTDELAAKLGELCGVAIDAELLDRLREAELELQQVVTGRSRESLQTDYEWLSSRSRASIGVATSLPFTGMQRRIARQQEQIHALEEHGRRREEELRELRRREEELQERLSNLGELHQKAHDDLAAARTSLQAMENDFGATRSELQAARAEAELWRSWREQFERRLPVRFFRFVQRLLRH